MIIVVITNSRNGSCNGSNRSIVQDTLQEKSHACRAEVPPPSLWSSFLHLGLLVAAFVSKHRQGGVRLRLSGF